MAFKGVTIACLLVLLVGLLIAESEGRSLGDEASSQPVDSPDVSNSDDGSIKKKQDTTSITTALDGPPAAAEEGGTKTFQLISHLLNKLPFWNRNKETVTTVTTTNSQPNLPAVSTGTLTGK